MRQDFIQQFILPFPWLNTAVLWISFSGLLNLAVFMSAQI